MRILFTLLLLVSLTGCRSTSRLEVVDGFEIDRYLGVWHEAARLPHRFEKNLAAVTATYSQNPDGTIKVLNRGFHTERRAWEEIEGVAKFKGEQSRGLLKVSFFKPFYASYRIIHLDQTYSRAIVTGPTYNYLWILVRDPAIPDEELDSLIRKAADFGFDTDQLIRVSPEAAE
jgi:apolipoprotein D and lipocalin family protein